MIAYVMLPISEEAKLGQIGSSSPSGTHSACGQSETVSTYSMTTLPMVACFRCHELLKPAGNNTRLSLAGRWGHL